jgi:hypothetical protein
MRLRALSKYPPANKGHKNSPERSRKLLEDGATEPHGKVNR